MVSEDGETVRRGKPYGLVRVGVEDVRAVRRPVDAEDAQGLADDRGPDGERVFEAGMLGERKVVDGPVTLWGRLAVCRLELAEARARIRELQRHGLG